MVLFCSSSRRCLTGLEVLGVTPLPHVDGDDAGEEEGQAQEDEEGDDDGGQVNAALLLVATIAGLLAVARGGGAVAGGGGAVGRRGGAVGGGGSAVGGGGGSIAVGGGGRGSAVVVGVGVSSAGSVPLDDLGRRSGAGHGEADHELAVHFSCVVECIAV